MKNGTYHRDLEGGIPQLAINSFLGVPLFPDYSRHAMMAAVNDRYTNPGSPWTAPKSVVLKRENIVEASIEDGVAVKIVVRVMLDWRRDLVLVLQQPDSLSHVFVRTLWINEANDKHSTLDKSKYAN